MVIEQSYANNFPQNKMTYRPLVCEKDKELVIVNMQLHCVFSTKTNVMYRNIIDDMAEATFYKVMNNLSLGVASKHQVKKVIPCIP